MKRSGFKPKLPVRREAKQVGAEYTLRQRAVAVAVAVAGPARATVPVPKESPLQNETYMAAVRQLPCYRCGIVGFTQFCHADEGKGEKLKTDCRLGWPGCGPHDEIGRTVPGCHYVVGSTGALGKQGRRDFERQAGSDTRVLVYSMGLWPANLPLWPGDVVP